MKIYQQFCLYSICVLVLSSATSSIGTESPVLDEPFGYDVMQTWDECVDMDENGWVGLADDCFEELDPIFLRDDVWGFNLNHSKDVLPYLRELGRTRLDVNLRAIHLPYTFEDLDLLPDRPKMRDVFDIQRIEREPIVDNVLHDPQCSTLTNGPWRLDTSLNERCHARDLVLYAYWIDTCVTNFNLYKRLNMPYEIYNRIFELSSGESMYKSKGLGDSLFIRNQQKLLEKRRAKSIRGTGSTAMIETVVSGGLNSKVTVEQLTDMNLKNLWVMRQCESFPHDLYQEPVEGLPQLGITSTGIKPNHWLELMELHDTLMGIAIRTGDKWAIRSFAPPQERRDEFMSFLSKVNPSLYHRYMSTHEYGPKADKDRLEHALSAFKFIRTELDEALTIEFNNEVLTPVNRLSHYTKLNKFYLSDKYDAEYLDSLLEKRNSEKP